MIEWQHIDTAPKDGSHILCYDGKYIRAVYWNDGNQNWDHLSDAYESVRYFATHWMPLPKPPKKEHFCETDYYICYSVDNELAFKLKIVDSLGYKVEYCPICGEKAND